MGGGRRGLVTTYEVGVGVGYGLVYKTYPGTTPPLPLPSSIKIPGCAPELVSCLKADEWKF